MISYDEDLLFEAVAERRASGRSYYLPPEEIAYLIANKSWQTQCRIIEHCVDFAHDNPQLAQTHS